MMNELVAVIDDEIDITGPVTWKNQTSK